MSAEAALPNPATAAAAPAKTGRKKLLIAAVALLVLGSGAAAAWYLNQQAQPAGKPGVAAPAPKKPAKKPIFATLDAFTVNLKDERGERLAQIGVTLQIEDSAVEVDIKDHLPAVRNNILLLISAKRMDELLSPEGKQVLAEEIRGGVARGLGLDKAAPNPVQGVLFSQFILQ